jgi:uncharacterized membrane protein
VIIIVLFGFSGCQKSTTNSEGVDSGSIFQRPNEFVVYGNGTIKVRPGSIFDHPITIRNKGTESDVYSIIVSSTSSWISLNEPIEPIALEGGEEKVLILHVNVPIDAPLGNEEVFEAMVESSKVINLINPIRLRIET